LPALARRGLLNSDIERYSRRPALDMHEAQRVYDWAMSESAAEVGLNRDDWLRQAAGDGEFVVLPEGVHEPTIIGPLLTALAARLREYNRSRTPESRVRLRVAIHHGLIHLDGPTGFPGLSAVVVARLLNAGAVREVLRQRPNVNLVAIISQEVYADVVLNRYEGLRPELFQRVHVEDAGKDFAADAWIYAPEEDLTRPPSCH
jgi:hypothetical protein